MNPRKEYECYGDFDADEAFGLKPIFPVDVKVKMALHRMFRENEDKDGLNHFIVVDEVRID